MEVREPFVKMEVRKSLLELEAREPFIEMVGRESLRELEAQEPFIEMAGRSPLLLAGLFLRAGLTGTTLTTL